MNPGNTNEKVKIYVISTDVSLFINCLCINCNLVSTFTFMSNYRVIQLNVLQYCIYTLAACNCISQTWPRSGPAAKSPATKKRKSCFYFVETGT